MDEARNTVVYEGPDCELVPDLMAELVESIHEDGSVSSFVRAAMAHLNLVMIHPFRDGNGRMARCLQTLILARDEIVAPEFSSVEEFLGRNTPDYYKVLAELGAGSWNPTQDATAWVKFILRAHHIHAQTVVARLKEASFMWAELDTLADRKGLPERCVAALFDASMGLRLRRSGYIKLAEVEDRTATRDLQALVDAELLTAHGERRGRTYSATDELRRIRKTARGERLRITDPYMTMSN